MVINVNINAVKDSYSEETQVGSRGGSNYYHDRVVDEKVKGTNITPKGILSADAKAEAADSSIADAQIKDGTLVITGKAAGTTKVSIYNSDKESARTITVTVEKKEEPQPPKPDEPTTGLLDPEISVRPIEGQIDDLVSEINKEVEKKNKVFITTLTKRMAEDLTDYMRELGIRVRYLHSDIDTLERTEIVRDMRLDVFDVLVGINLLREGLDIPEITLVAILDADKEGFLRSETSLIQTIGRAARNAEGHVIMYADTITDSMRAALDETQRRREVQMAYNEEHGITPKTIQKAVRDLIAVSKKVAASEVQMEKDPESMSEKELEKLIKELEKQMKKAAADLNFEAAAELRDKLIELKKTLQEIKI